MNVATKRSRKVAHRGQRPALLVEEPLGKSLRTTLEKHDVPVADDCVQLRSDMNHLQRWFWFVVCGFDKNVCGTDTVETSPSFNHHRETFGVSF